MYIYIHIYIHTTHMHIIYMYASVRVYTCTFRGQKIHPLELELEAIVSH